MNHRCQITVSPGGWKKSSVKHRILSLKHDFLHISWVLLVDQNGIHFFESLLLENNNMLSNSLIGILCRRKWKGEIALQSSPHPSETPTCAGVAPVDCGNQPHS